MPQQPTPEQFWQFCLQLYPTIQQPLLTLQDELAANVNLLLLLLYAEQQHWQWSLADIQQLQQAVTPINQLYTLPIRQLRQKLSREPRLKQALLQAELEAEKLEQQALLAALPKPGNGSGNDLLMSYLQQLHPDNVHWQSLLFDLRQSLAD
ncbi:MAG: TIGR02444 family protein [Alkalimonas sp.]|nr:TIGR02444 family protein [Alkalimonas sp.]